MAAEQAAPGGGSTAPGAEKETSHAPASDPHRSDHFSQLALRKAARTIVDRPCSCAFTSLFCMLLCAGIVGQMEIVIDAGGGAFRAQSDSTALNYDAALVATLDVVSPPKAPDAVQPERSMPYGSVTLVYEAADDADVGSMLGLKALKAVCEAEKALTSTVDFQTFCLRGEDGRTCAAPVSVMSMLFDLDGETGLPQYNCAALAQADVDGLTATLTSNPESVAVPNAGLTTPVYADYFLPKGFDAAATEAAVTRSLVVWGLPLAGYNNTDQPDPSMKGAPLMRASAEQTLVFEGWAGDSLLQSLDSMSNDDISVRFRGTHINDVVFQGIMLSDTNWAFVSLIFVFVYCWFHMRSLYYSAVGLFGVVMSLPVALFVYRVVLQIPVFGTLNFLGLFVILGSEWIADCAACQRLTHIAVAFVTHAVGADDLFLFRDAYVQMGVAMERAIAAGVQMSASDLKYGRMEAAYSRSATAMAITTATTALSFAGNIVSIIPPVREFGTFTSILVVVNYLIVISWFPACVIGMEWAKATRCGRRQPATPHTSGGIELPSVRAPASGQVSPLSAGSPEVRIVEAGAARALEQYFGGPHAKTVHKLRKPLLAMFFVFIVLCTIAATQVETSEEPAQFLPEDHPFWRSVLLRQDFQLPSRAVNDGSGGNVIPTSVQFQLLFGVSGIDREAKDETDPSDLGDVIWDDGWDITDPAAQQHILDVCDALETDLPDTVVSGVSGCFIRPFSTWVVKERGLTFPLDDANTANAEALILQWFRDQGPVFSNPYTQQLGFSFANNPPTLEFVKLVVDTPIRPFSPATRVEPLYDRVVEFVEAQNAAGPASAQAMMTSFWWMIMRTESVLVDTAILCASVSVALAFLLLLVASRDIVITVVSTLCIVCVVATVLAFMWAAGWTLGIIESINLTVLVGISVDYTVHLAVAYGLHARGTRYERMRIALEHMGISVFSAAVTTIGSAVFLTFTVVLFFVRFGIFIVVTLASSLVVAFVLFPAILFVFGPETDDSDEADAGSKGAVDRILDAAVSPVHDVEAGKRSDRSAALAEAGAAGPSTDS